MTSVINRGIKKIRSFFTSEKNPKCRNCSVVKSGGLTPAIVFTERNINHDDCNANCGLDNKATFLIARLLFIFLVGYLVYRYGAIAYHVVLYYFS